MQISFWLKVLEWVMSHKALTATLLALAVTAVSLQITTWQRDSWKAEAKQTQQALNSILQKAETQRQASTKAAADVKVQAAKYRRLYAALKQEALNAKDVPMRDACPALEHTFRLLHVAGEEGRSPN